LKPETTDDLEIPDMYCKFYDKTIAFDHEIMICIFGIGDERGAGDCRRSVGCDKGLPMMPMFRKKDLESVRKI
jgi:hypothetical protein